MIKFHCGAVCTIVNERMWRNVNRQHAEVDLFCVKRDPSLDSVTNYAHDELYFPSGRREEKNGYPLYLQIFCLQKIETQFLFGTYG